MTPTNTQREEALKILDDIFFQNHGNKPYWDEEAKTQYDRIRAAISQPAPIEGAYTVDDNGDYEWVVDPETGEGMSPRKICDMLNAYAQGRTQSVPDGWKLVPIEPTEEMMSKALEYGWKRDYFYTDVYKAMLSAAPTPPVTGGAWKAASEIDELEPSNGDCILAELVGDDTGKTRYVVLEWDTFMDEWRFDGSELSYAWTMTRWCQFDLPPTQPESGE